ncbi:MAG TPA: DUF3857 domain-containing protein [Mucilaginibacter sp.]
MGICFGRLKVFFLGLIIFVFGVKQAIAAQPVVHISPKPDWLTVCKPYDKKPSLRTVEDGYYFSIIEHQVHIEKQADYRHNVREIVSETGIQNGSEISVSFDPTYERLDFHDITVWRNGKPQNRLNPSAFKIIADEKDLSNFIYQGTYSALCILSDIRKGDRIEYSYTVTGRNPIFNNKYSGFLFLQYYQTVAHQYTSVIFSSSHKMNMKLFNKAEKPVITEAGGFKRYEWETFQIRPALYDENAPSWYDGRDYIQLTDYNNWSEVINWAMGINPPKLALSGELAEQVAKLKKDAGDDKEKYFRNAVKTVQDEVRYMGIELGEYSHRANNPEKVFSQRYGDCKDKSLLLVSMLRANGIDANMVLINSGGDGLDKYLPAHNLFDHATVVAEVNGKQVWVDPTIGYQRGKGTDIYFPSYGQGLILKAGNTKLTKIPPPKIGKIVATEIFKVKDAKSPVTLEVKTVYTLNQADKERDQLASSGMAEIEKSYLKYYSRVYNKIEAIDSVAVKDDEDKNELTTIEKYKITDYFKKDTTTGYYSTSFYASEIKQQLPEITNQTKTPIATGYPFDEDFTTIMYFPLGWDITEKHDAINRDAYQFSSDYSASGDTLTLNYKFKYLQKFVPVEKLGEFKDDIKKLSDTDLSYSIDFNPDATKQAAMVNKWLVGLVAVIILACAFLGIFIYRRETPGIVFEYGQTFVPIGGWLILVTIGLCLTPLIEVVNLIDTNYFTMLVWKRISTYSYGDKLKAHVIFKIVGDTLLICYAVFCLVLMLKRRDILPKFIIGYFLYAVVLRIGDYAMISYASKLQIPDEFGETIFRTIVVAAIWVPYFMRSTRVKQTFIVPYPEHNYSYEELEAKE